MNLLVLFGKIGSYLKTTVDITDFKFVVVGVSTIFYFLFTSTDQRSILIMLVVAVFIDTVTGIIAAIKNGRRIRSGIGGLLDGAIKMFVYTMLLGFSNIFGQYLPTGNINGNEIGIAELTALWLIANEFKSMIENIDASGYPVPKMLLKTIKKFLSSSNVK